MVDQVSHSPSHIPVHSTRSPKLVRNGKHDDTEVSASPTEERLFNKEHDDLVNSANGLNNGSETHEKSLNTKPQKPLVPTELKIDKTGKKLSDKGFETFLMTGEMIIKTNPSQKHKKDGSGLERHHSDSAPYEQSVEERKTFKRSASSPDQTVFNGANLQVEVEDNPTIYQDDIKIESLINRKPSAESGFEEQATHSDTGTLEKKEKLPNDPASISDLSELESDDLLGNMIESQSSAVSSSVSAVSTPSDLKSDISVNTVLQQEVEPLINEDSSSSSSSIEISSAESGSGDLTPEMIFERSLSDSGGMSPVNQQDVIKYMITSKSAEKIVYQKQSQQKTQDGSVVRASKSQEHYFVDDFTFVSIDIDDTAYSLDQIPQQAERTPDFEKCSVPNLPLPSSSNLPQSNDLSSTGADSQTDKVFMPSFIPFKDTEQNKSQNDNSEQIDDETSEKSDGDKLELGEILSKEIGAAACMEADDMDNGALDSGEDGCDSVESEEGVLKQDVLFSPPPAKGVDHPSAKRLAKRLYKLDGFRKSDVSRHLCKKNDFSTLVAEEYLRFFNFAGDSLDVALRKFLKQFSLIGETQERERILAHFSRHYMQSNPGAYNSEDACHTLVCALMLLNTDLHGQAVGRKMTCNEFIENLSELNDGENFPKEVLKALYTAIKADPIEWAPDEEFQEAALVEQPALAPAGPSLPVIAGSNPFVDVPNPETTTEYKKGYMMRKCCVDPDGRKTPVGKRGWKMMYVVLKDMILYLYKDEQGMKKAHNDNTHSANAIRVHHCLASKASDYHKKQHVFRLQTADWAEYLFQTSNTKELQEWVDTLNFVAASLSAPPLPGAVGSQKKFQKPLLPVTYTRLNMQDQLHSLEERLSQMEQDLVEHRKYAPEKGSKASAIQQYMEKENYLIYEVGRLKTYTYLLKSRLTSHMDLEPSLVETSIGEEEEGIKGPNQANHHPVVSLGPKKTVAQRSITDRDTEESDKPSHNSNEPAQLFNSTGDLINLETEVTRF